MPLSYLRLPVYLVPIPLSCFGCSSRTDLAVDCMQSDSDGQQCYALCQSILHLKRATFECCYELIGVRYQLVPIGGGGCLLGLPPGPLSG